MNQVVARAERSISEIAGLSLGVQFALSPNVTLVALPLASLEQIVLGLCTAACGLLGPGGRLVIETRGINDAPFTQAGGVIEPDEARARVVVRAEQLGHGSPSASQAERRVEASAQPALGLAAVEQLLARLGGRLEVVPLSGGDLAYVAHLPQTIGTDSSGRMAVAVPEQSGVILLIEDEPQVQAVTTRILRAFGYTVITAHNERSALAQAEQYGPSIGLVVSDLVLPGVSGKDLV
ncbi:MAG TPA: response regulator, partial [Polyangiaceae bacterium]